MATAPHRTATPVAPSWAIPAAADHLLYLTVIAGHPILKENQARMEKAQSQT
jgi:hypothetical protein